MIRLTLHINQLLQTMPLINHIYIRKIKHAAGSEKSIVFNVNKYVNYKS